jgi:thioredoxin-related protein
MVAAARAVLAEMRTGIVRAAAALLLALGVAAALAANTNSSPFSHFSGSLQEELAQAKAENKKGTLVIFELEGCGDCKQLDSLLLKSARARRYYESRFRIVRVELGAPEFITDFNGRRIRKMDFAQAQRVVAAPTLVFFDSGGLPVTRFAGTPKSGTELEAIGRYVADAAYESQPLSAYLARR